jgi:HAD superfamily hydrolase (TIGR01490 family)
MKPKLALFDFDGTITHHDSFLHFIMFYKGKFRFFIGLLFLSPVFVFYKLGLLKNSKAKELVFYWFIKGDKIADFQRKCDEFGNNVIPNIIRKEALEEIQNHFRNGNRVIIVSASAENWLKQWCSNINVELLGTRLEVIDGKLTGKIAGENCHGEEKVNRIREHLNIKEFDEIFAYGDSAGDLPMINLAHNKYYKPFKA